MRRVAVVGTSGSGKSTLSRRLAERLSVPYVELDALFHGPGWTEPTLEDFRRRVAAATAGEGWVVDGGYASWVDDLVRGPADAVVWLDYERWLVAQRVVRRTLRRVVTRQELWNGNREPWSNVWSWDPERNVVVWSWTTHRPNRVRNEAAMDDRWVRLRNPAEARRWLAGVSPAGAST